MLLLPEERWALWASQRTMGEHEGGPACENNDSGREIVSPCMIKWCLVGQAWIQRDEFHHHEPMELMSDVGYGVGVYISGMKLWFYEYGYLDFS